jgi:2-dehydro-3-deoxyphosphooctonate aldolase (KDO 8-P synthase)
MNKDKVWILGPCSLESEDLFFSVLKEVNSIMSPTDQWYMKASFDKANRTSLHGGRGSGLDYSKEVWRESKRRYPNIKLTTDVHECWQVEELCDLIDVAQIPAFLSRQTDLIVECAKHFSIINVKKGQWLGPNNVTVSVDKIKEVNSSCEAWVTDRGSNFGYHDLFVNFGIVDELKEHYDKVIIDCTHSTQRSRSVYGTQGDSTLAARYFVACDIFNYDGVFAEVHPDPISSVSDGECAIHLDNLRGLVARAKAVGVV